MVYAGVNKFGTHNILDGYYLSKETGASTGHRQEMAVMMLTVQEELSCYSVEQSAAAAAAVGQCCQSGGQLKH